MPRPLRIDFPGANHHVMNRGAKRKNVFFDDDYCSLFCDFLAQIVERFDIRLHGFALMPNHYHLMVESVNGNLSQAMSYLNGKYTQAVNKERGIDGSLFRGRYHNRVVTDSSHWRYLLAYLHLNPVKARLVMRIDQWPWTSHRFYDGKYVSPDWLTTEKLFTEIGGTDGYRRYLKEIIQGRKD
jgi:putative transposase